MIKQKEIEILMQLTGATDGQIKINEVGWTSRTYIIDDGRIVFKFPRNKQAQEALKYETKVQELISHHKFNLKAQIDT